MLSLKKCPIHLIDYYKMVLVLSHIKSLCTEENGYYYSGYSIHMHNNLSIAKSDDINALVSGDPSQDILTLDPQWKVWDILYSIDEN